MAKYFYALIDQENLTHYGYTFDEKKAREEANRLDKEHGCHIVIYEFGDYSEF